MTISVKGNDAFTLTNCMSALDQVIKAEEIAAAANVELQSLDSEE